MSNVFEVSKSLKAINSPDGNDRLARAVFLANSAAFSLGLSMPVSPEGQEDATKRFTALAKEVNEHTPLDIRLAIPLFQRALRIRLELLAGTADPAIIKAALCGPTAEDINPEKEQAMNEWLTSRTDFDASQRELSQQVGNFFTAQQ